MTPTLLATSDRLRERLAAGLAEARERTLTIVGALSDDDLHRQHDPLMSPVLWDLGHIAAFEELWLTRNLEGVIEFTEMPGLYNPFEHPRRVRGQLRLPGLAGVRGTMGEIRQRVLARLRDAELDGGNELLRGGYVYNMVLQHEYQHGETILQTLQLKQGAPYTPPVRWSVGEGRTLWPPDAMVRFPGGS
ncbi:MAG TPA: DinB family protein, partial [Gemmatimonadales bacterium]|nr:DinB family protein [Gemmatimonadales bacterium]